MHDEYLIHFQRKGAHWGVKNGPPYPLNQKGLARFRKNKNKGEHDEKNPGFVKRTASKAVASIKAKRQAKKEFEERQYHDPKKMSDEELQKAINRLQLEQKYNQLNPKSISTGEKFIKNLKDKAATELPQMLISQTKNMIEKKLEEAFSEEVLSIQDIMKKKPEKLSESEAKRLADYRKNLSISKSNEKTFLENSKAVKAELNRISEEKKQKDAEKQKQKEEKKEKRKEKKEGRQAEKAERKAEAEKAYEEAVKNRERVRAEAKRVYEDAVKKRQEQKEQRAATDFNKQAEAAAAVAKKIREQREIKSTSTPKNYDVIETKSGKIINGPKRSNVGKVYLESEYSNKLASSFTSGSVDVGRNFIQSEYKTYDPYEWMKHSAIREK